MEEKNRPSFIAKILAKVVLRLFLVLAFCPVFSSCTNKPYSPGTTRRPIENYIERFKPGTKVEGIDISSLSYSEASDLLFPTAEKICSSYDCRLYHNGETYMLTSSDLNVSIDIDDTLDAAMKSGSGEYKFKCTINAGDVLEKRLDEFAESIFEEPTVSKPVWNSRTGVGFQEASAGVELDKEKTWTLIVSGMREIEMPVKETAVKKPKAKCILRGKFSTTFYAWNDEQKDRAFNIELASKKLNETVLKPGEELSCNHCFGERNRKNGWRKAAAFTNGGRDSEDQYGGGICQVSTTLYNAALLADLTVTNRCGHSKPVYYADPGTDAAISGDVTDLCIKNDTDGDIYIFMWVDGQSVFCEIYGREFGDEFDEIRLTSQYIESIFPGEPIFEPSSELAAGECKLRSEAVCGSIYLTYRLYYKCGNLVKKVNVSKTEYLAHPAVYLVGK